ncbi:MAG: hypothetical protein EBR28_08110 [Planctomycetia bacterium]|nr:hypothetical protein [Planctomycetia bacterium]
MIAAGVVGATAGNPFSTRHVRPGCLPPLDAAGRPIAVGDLCMRLAQLGGSAALVGPHGSGKTTLLWKICAALEADGVRVSRVRIRDLGDILTLAAVIWRRAGGGTVCVDSWERVGRPLGWFLRAAARIVGTRLVITAHRAGSLPTLWECSTSTPLLEAIVARLPGTDAGPTKVRPDDVVAAFRRSGGNIREALYVLYDVVEERLRRTGARSTTDV